MPDSTYNNTCNPDVLSSLANRSNDEVFTPPSIANARLDRLPLELFRDPMKETPGLVAGSCGLEAFKCHFLSPYIAHYRRIGEHE